jgi:hypothetical protein
VITDAQEEEGHKEEEALGHVGTWSAAGGRRCHKVVSFRYKVPAATALTYRASA